MINSNIPNLDSMSMVRAKVDFYNGFTLVETCTCADYLEDFEITREGDNSKFFGFGICHKLNINLIDLLRTLKVTKENTVEIGLGDGSIWDAPYPTFYITELKRDEKTNTITATAYDKIYWASEFLFKDLGISAPYTLGQVVAEIATKLGLTIKIPTSLNTAFALYYQDGANLEGTEDLRSILNWIAEATQTIYFVDYNNNLVFKRLDRDGDELFTITRDLYYELNTKTPRTLVTICNATELGDNIESSLDEEGAIQYVRNNPFLELRTDLSTILDKALAAVGGLTITQFDCDWSGNYLLEIGDKIALSTEDGGTVKSYLLSDTVIFAGTLNESTEWEYTDQQPETYANPTNIGERINQTFAKVNKIEKEITLYVGDIINEVLPGKIDEAVEEINSTLGADIDALKATTEQHTENISSLTLNTQSITSEVSSLKEANTTLTNELGEVVATQSAIQEDVSLLALTANQISASVSSAEQKITSLDTEIDNVSNQANTRIDTLSSDVALKLDKKGVEITIDQKLEEGVDKVVTASKKYTFDDTGLNVSSADSEFSTMVTDNGMTISKSSTEVLTVNNQGVTAADLHARTFLIIGENSRLEDRGNRTACFWIGPAGG